jgi:hypothetical protein
MSYRETEQLRLLMMASRTPTAGRIIWETWTARRAR